MATAVVAAVTFVLLAIWARSSPPAPWEVSVVDFLAIGDGPLDALVVALNTIGDLPVWLPLVTVVAILLGRVRGWIIAALVALTLVSDLVGFGVKILVERERPATAAVEHFFGPDSFAFPSGHVVRAVALLATLGFLLAPPRRRLPVALLSAAFAGLFMGFARVGLGVHWPTDALGGFLLGVAWFSASAVLLRRSFAHAA